MKALNFNTVKKSYMTVTLNDEKKTTVMVSTPSKEILEELTALTHAFNKTEEGEMQDEIINDLFNACAKALSRNKTRTKISADLLAEIFDLEDIFIFLNAYVEFTQKLSSEKN